jgi:hypothetical protein
VVPVPAAGLTISADRKTITLEMRDVPLVDQPRWPAIDSIATPARMTFKIVWKSTGETVQYESPAEQFWFIGTRAECHLEAAVSVPSIGFCVEIRSDRHIHRELRNHRRGSEWPILFAAITWSRDCRRLADADKKPDQQNDAIWGHFRARTEAVFTVPACKPHERVVRDPNFDLIHAVECSPASFHRKSNFPQKVFDQSHRNRLHVLDIGMYRSATQPVCFGARDQKFINPIKGPGPLPSALFCAQRLHGIAVSGPARRHDARGQGDCCEKQWHHSEGHWIVWCDAKQETLQESINLTHGVRFGWFWRYYAFRICPAPGRGY